MRVLLATTAGAGHFGPMVPFASACVRAGHEVLVAAPESFSAHVKRAGFEHWPCADIESEALAKARERIVAAEPEKMNETTIQVGAELAARAMLPRLLAAVDEWRPGLILRELGETGSLVAGDLRGVRQAQVLVGLDKFVDFTVPLAAPALAGLREEYGLSGDPAGKQWLGMPSVSLFPPSFEEPRDADGPRILRYRDPSNGSASLPSQRAKPSQWANENDPLCYVTFGTVSGSLPFAASALREVVESLASLPVRLLVTIGDDGEPADWGGLPPNVRVERWVPQRDVLAHASVMVCHGGAGTVLGALAAGVPLVVVPQFADHPDNAERVAAVGAGLRIGIDGRTTPLDPVAVRHAVHQVLTEHSFRDAVGRIAAEIRSLPPATEVTSLLETGS
jgi:UDP:flavonoid glycosyltransferase YjiC (YdhE family)